MVKFTAAGRTPGVVVVGLGLSHLNIQKLLAGQPIHVRLQDLNLPYPVEIMILAGENENRIADDLEKAGFEMPDPDKIHIDPALKG
jgi:hypothetical protein